MTIKLLSHAIEKFDQWTFPGGEIGVKLHFKPYDFQGMYTPGFRIDWLVNNKSELHFEYFAVANIIDAIRQKFGDNAIITVFLPYFPYARQDRVCHEGESHALNVFEKIILALDFTFLNICDVHSLNNNLSKDSRVHLFTQEQILTGSFNVNLRDYDFVVAPDAGALEKAKKIVPYVSNGFYVALNKVRKDGKVIHEEYHTMKQLAILGILVDDICDGGATFISAANALKKNNKHLELDLYVTHGIFSKGLDELKLHFRKIFCYNLMNLDLVEQVEHII